MEYLPRFLSHLLFFYLLVGEPISGEILYRNLVKNLSSQSKARLNYYYSKLSIYWIWVALVILIGITINKIEPVIWIKPLNDRGWLLLAMAVTAGILLYFFGYRRGKSFGLLGNSDYHPVYLPTGSGDRLIYSSMVFSSSLSEELVYRGFVWFYLQMVFPQMPIWVIIVISSIMYTAGHYYHIRSEVPLNGLQRIVNNWKRIAATILAGCFLGLMVAICGSIIPSIVLHLVSEVNLSLVKPTAGDSTTSRGREQPLVRG